MSGARATDEFLTIKTRQLSLLNPDESFPQKGLIMTVVDGHGTIEPTDEIMAESITATTINIIGPIHQASIIASDISSEVITTDTVNVINTLSSPDISVNHIDTNLLFARQLVQSRCLTSTNMRTPLLNASGNFSAHKVRVTDHVNAISATTENISGTTVVIQTFNSTNALTASSLTTPNISAYDVSAGGASFVNTYTQSGYSRSLCGTNMYATTMTSNDINVTLDLSANNLNSLGTFKFGTLALDTLKTGSVFSLDISAGDISANSAAFTTVNVQRFDISQININGLFSATFLNPS